MVGAEDVSGQKSIKGSNNTVVGGKIKIMKKGLKGGNLGIFELLKRNAMWEDALWVDVSFLNPPLYYYCKRT